MVPQQEGEEGRSYPFKNSPRGSDLLAAATTTPPFAICPQSVLLFLVLLLLLRFRCFLLRYYSEVLRLYIVRPSPVLQLHGAPPIGRVETRHHAPLAVELGLGLEAAQLHVGADGNGR